VPRRDVGPVAPVSVLPHSTLFRHASSWRVPEMALSVQLPARKDMAACRQGVRVLLREAVERGAVFCVAREMLDRRPSRGSFFVSGAWKVLTEGAEDWRTGVAPHGFCGLTSVQNAPSACHLILADRPRGVEFDVRCHDRSPFACASLTADDGLHDGYY
jgi:hypothetical protein